MIITAGRQGEQTLLARAMDEILGTHSTRSSYPPGAGNEQERLALLEAHRAGVAANLAETQECLRLIDHKIDVYRGRVAAGDADRLWAATR